MSKVFDYQIKDLVVRPSDERVNKIFALLGKKFHLHTIEYSFTPDEVVLDCGGIPGTITEILDFNENGVFARITGEDLNVFAKIDSGHEVGEEVHISLDANKLGVRDVNFNVIIF